MPQGAQKGGWKVSGGGWKVGGGRWNWAEGGLRRVEIGGDR